MEIGKTEYRAVIKFLTKKGKKPQEILDDLVDVYGSSAPSKTTVFFWSNEFKRGRQSLEDDPRSGRPVEVTTDEMAARVNTLLLEDRRVTHLEIADSLGISVGSVNTILHDILGKRKVAARWVPRLLTVENRSVRVAMSKQLLALYRPDPEKFLQRLVTGDESWVHHYEPESKQQSMQWIGANSPTPKKARTVPSAGKLMGTFFWDSEGIILIDYLPRGQTMNGAYYAGLLGKLKAAIKEKRRGKWSKGVLLQHDNARVHTCQVSTAAADQLGFEILPHPPYSPDLAPSDFFLFGNLKKNLRGKRFNGDNEMQSAISDYFEGIDSDYFLNGLKALEKRWKKCIEVFGDYVEKD